MRKIITFLTAILFTTCLYAQVPQQMSYQAVIRNAANTLVTNHAIGMKISILQGGTTAVYIETQTPTSNANGLVSMEIGSGNVVLGSFSTIDWANGPYFLQTDTDPAGGTAYSITGKSQLLSVPYALSSGDNKWSSNGDGIHNTNSGNVGIGTTSPATMLDVKSINSNVANFNGGNQMYITLSESDIPRGYIGSYAGRIEDVDFGTYSGSSGSVHLTTSDVPKLTVVSNGNVGIGTTSPGTKLEVNGATKLGSDAPAIKMLKLTGTTSNADGGEIAIPHGLKVPKILAVNVLVEWLYFSYTTDVPAHHNTPGFEYTYYIDDDNIYIDLIAGNCYRILSAPIKILVTYEE